MPRKSGSFARWARHLRLREGMEGPSLVILREELAPYVGKKITTASGNTKQLDLIALRGKALSEVRSWGKHFLMRFGTGTWLKIHFLMYGSYRINDPKKGREPRM